MYLETLHRSRWSVPSFSLLMGIVLFGAAAIGGHPSDGLLMLGIMAAFGVAILLAGRSETIRGLRGDGRDERFARIDLQATAFAGLVVILTIIGGFVYELSQGRDGMMYAWLGAVGGIAYLLAVLMLRLRS